MLEIFFKTLVTNSVKSTSSSGSYTYWKTAISSGIVPGQRQEKLSKNMDPRIIWSSSSPLSKLSFSICLELCTVEALLTPEFLKSS